MKKLFLLGIIALGFVAFGATAYTRILNLQVPGKTLLGSTTESNAIDTSVVADVDYDFPNATIVCNDSPAVTATGAAVGDTCFASFGPRDGGSQIVTANIVLSAFVDSANTVKVRACPVGTAANPVDAGYVVRCFSSP